MAEGIFMITLPMPFRLKHVNIFLFSEEGGFTLIDTGPNLHGVLPALEASLAEIGRRVEECRRILITHFHMDHCGLAGIIAGRSGASVYLSEIEELTIRAFAQQEDRASRIRRFISRTASRKPTKIARLTMAWPMCSSRIPGKRASGCTLK